MESIIDICNKIKAYCEDPCTILVGNKSDKKREINLSDAEVRITKYLMNTSISTYFYFLVQNVTSSNVWSTWLNKKVTDVDDLFSLAFEHVWNGKQRFIVTVLWSHKLNILFYFNNS